MGSVVQLKLKTKPAMAIPPAQPTQLELFGDRSALVGFVCFIDYAALDRDAFCSILAKQQVHSIMDFRSRKAFSNNTDVHRRVVEYIVGRRIKYVDMFLGHERFGHSYFSYISDVLGECLSGGLAVILYNGEDSNIDGGALRFMISRHPTYRAELSPRSL